MFWFFLLSHVIFEMVYKLRVATNWIIIDQKISTKTPSPQVTMAEEFFDFL